MQVADDYISLDVLSTQMDVRASNFRRINVKGLAVYGMAQPGRHVRKIRSTYNDYYGFG